MSRRVRVPAADELFRRTASAEEESERGGGQVVSLDRAETPGPPGAPGAAEAPEAPEAPGVAPVADDAATVRPPAPPARGPSGRVRHDEKMTVYVTSDELLDLEHARLVLRRLGYAVDRGRLVREAVAMVLADLEDHGTDSALVRRLAEA